MSGMYYITILLAIIGLTKAAKNIRVDKDTNLLID